MKKVSSVEEYLEVNSHFGEALHMLRALICSTELVETLKWSSPVYELKGKKVLGLGAFKNHFGIWFFNGVFLRDEEKVLVAAQKTTKALRQMRFESIKDINKDVILSYIKEAIENQKLGKEIKPERKGNIVSIPLKLKLTLDEHQDLKKAFINLTPSKQREYCEYIETAKREATKSSRIEKIIPLIQNGHGLNERYKK